MADCSPLTSEQLKTTNGCGSSFWLARPFRVPKWISRQFWACCNRHDIRYQKGKNLAQKYQADDELYDCMYYSAYHGPRWKRWFLLKMADFTYWCLSTRLSFMCFNVSKSKESL